MPTSGGLYYAAAVLAPPGWGPFAAWVTGWSNWLAQVTGAPSVNYALSAMILAAASITNPDYIPENWHVFLLTMLIMIIHGFISSMPTAWIAQFNSAGSTFNIIALVIVIILIPAANDRESRGLSKWNSSSDVWGNFYQGTEFPNGVAMLMSFISVCLIICLPRCLPADDTPLTFDCRSSGPCPATTRLSILPRSAVTPISLLLELLFLPLALAASLAGSYSLSPHMLSSTSTMSSSPTSASPGRLFSYKHSVRKLRSPVSA